MERWCGEKLHNEDHVRVRSRAKEGERRSGGVCHCMHHASGDCVSSLVRRMKDKIPA